MQNGFNAELIQCRIISMQNCFNAELFWCRTVLMKNYFNAELSQCSLFFLNLSITELFWQSLKVRFICRLLCKLLSISMIQNYLDTEFFIQNRRMEFMYSRLRFQCRIVSMQNCFDLELFQCRIVSMQNYLNAELF